MNILRLSTAQRLFAIVFAVLITTSLFVSAAATA